MVDVDASVIVAVFPRCFYWFVIVSAYMLLTRVERMFNKSRNTKFIRV